MNLLKHVILGSSLGLAACAGTNVNLVPPSGGMVEAMRQAGATSCVQTAASVMTSIGAAADNIKQVSTDRRVNGSPDSQNFQGYTIWTSFNDRSGRVVTYTRPDCSFLSVFTRGDISIENGKLS